MTLASPQKIHHALLKARNKKPGRGIKQRMVRCAALALEKCIESRLIRKVRNTLRTEDKVLRKYDAMAGSYIDDYNILLTSGNEILTVYDGVFDIVPYNELSEKYFSYISKNILEPLEPQKKCTIEIGAGELTTSIAFAQRVKFSEISALELSWSRIAAGRQFAESKQVDFTHLLAGTALDLPLSDNSFDIVITSHCLEQIPMHVHKVLSELYRVSREYIVLLEPSYELGDSYQKMCMKRKHFVRGLDKIIRERGYRLERHELLPYCWSFKNRTALYLIKKEVSGSRRPIVDKLACPLCKESLFKPDHQFYFCKSCGILYPVVGGIPCLNPANGILATKYEQFSS